MVNEGSGDGSGSCFLSAGSLSRSSHVIISPAQGLESLLALRVLWLHRATWWRANGFIDLHKSRGARSSGTSWGRPLRPGISPEGHSVSYAFGKVGFHLIYCRFPGI